MDIDKAITLSVLWLLSDTTYDELFLGEGILLKLNSRLIYVCKCDERVIFDNNPIDALGPVRTKNQICILNVTDSTTTLPINGAEIVALLGDRDYKVGVKKLREMFVELSNDVYNNTCADISIFSRDSKTLKEFIHKITKYLMFTGILPKLYTKVFKVGNNIDFKRIRNYDGI